MRLRWRGIRAAVGADEIGDPRNGTNYALCLYVREVLVGELDVPSGARWERSGTRGYAYRDSLGSAGPVRRLVVHGGVGHAAVRFAAKGIPLPEVALPVTLQLVNDDTPLCWESLYGSLNTVERTDTRFTARYRGVRRPSIILINTDDQPVNMLDTIPTVLAEIASKGVTFENSFVSTPLCAPSRATMLTGNHAHTHGVLNLGGEDGGADDFVGPDRQTIAVWLQRAGYWTGHFGKYVNGYQRLCDATSCYVPPGWDVWRAFPREHYFNYLLSENGPKVAYGGAPEDYSTDVLRDQVLTFLDEHPQEPVFVYFAPYAPHIDVPAYLPVPAPRYAGLSAGTPFWRPVSFMEPDVSDKPAWIQALAAVLDPQRSLYYDVQRLLAIESLAAEDEAVSAILAKLESQGRLTDTVVIFTSDNGFSFGEHRVFGKQCPYEECIRVPLMMRYDRLIRERGSVRSDLAVNIDIAPTLADWAQIPSGTLPPVDGVSLARVATGQEVLSRDATLIERWQGRRFAGVRTAEWKYLRHDTGERELYDLKNDPFELTNVVAENPALADQLEQRIIDLGGSLPDQ